MAGLGDYAAQAVLNWESGSGPMPALGSANSASRYLALFTTAPTADAGTGGTEVSGGSYARVAVAGQTTATASFTTSVNTISVASGMTWISAGMNVYDFTSGFVIGVVSGYAGTTLTLVGNASHASSGSADVLYLSAWTQSVASSGAEPSTTPANSTNTNATVSFPQATASWGTVTSWALYDAVTAGNFITWDYLGNFKWIPFSASNASPSVLTVDLAADAPANGTSCVVTSKFGGTLPTTGGSWAGILTSAGLSTNTFNLGVNSTSLGGGEFRQVVQQSIPINVTASFAPSTFTLSLA